MVRVLLPVVSHHGPESSGLARAQGTVKQQCFGNGQRPADRAGLSRHDQLFAMLDGQEIRGRCGAWRAEVVGIYAGGADTWVQIGPARRPEAAVVLRLRAAARVDRALAALSRWSDLPVDRRPHRIDVGQEGVSGIP